MMEESVRSLLKKIPCVPTILRTNAYRRFRYEMTLRFQERRNYLFTQFLRVPTQFDALVGPVIDFLLANRNGQSLSIIVWGCSNGAEPYSIASALLRRRPELDFMILALDIDEQMLEKARGGTYTREEVPSGPTVDTAFVEETFHIEQTLYRVKPAISSRVRFGIKNVLDANLEQLARGSDIVFAQNFLYHLKPDACKIAFNNVCRLLRSKAAVFVDGMDPGLRLRLTKIQGLEPLDYRIEEIHNEARNERGSAWPYEYWGLEPFTTSRMNWKRRYSTIFLKNDC
jgi:chemotaxis protein methyltransferase CheR